MCRRLIEGVDRARLRQAHPNLAVFDVTPQGFVGQEMFPGMTLDKRQALTEPRLQLAPNWQVLAPPAAPEARAASAFRATKSRPR